MWKKTTIKEPKSSSDLKVSIAILETCQCDWIVTVQQFEGRFKEALEVIRSPGGGHRIANFYKTTQRNDYSLEVWKLDSKGDFKELKWIVTRVNTKVS